MYAIILRENAAPQERDPHFVRACAVEMHVDMSQEPSYAIIYGKKMLRPDGAPWSSTGLYSYEPISVDTLLGDNIYQI